MVRSTSVLGAILLFLSLISPASLSSEKAIQEYWRIPVKGAIGPGVSLYLSERIESAATSSRPPEFILLLLDTPGGLEASMRAINQAILESTVPVITYVSPKGARAASAGTFILYASHVAAMAPATNLGAASPVQLIGGSKPSPKEQPASDSTQETLKQKQVNDAIAYIRALAELRGRNADWAEQAVRKAASLSSEQALELGVIDLVAESEFELLQQLEGLEVTVANANRQLHTQNLKTTTLEPDWRELLIMVITDPNIAYVLILLGFYGIVLEFYSPGFGVPGVVGSICLLLALFALQMLPVNGVGIALLLLGLVLMLAEAMVPSFGILGGGGVLAFILGSIFLFDSADDVMTVATPMIAALSVTSVGVLLVAVRLLIKAQKQPVVSGVEVLAGSKAIVKESFQGTGTVLMAGELWQAHCNSKVDKDQVVEVVEHTGLELEVAPVTEQTTQVSDKTTN